MAPMPSLALESDTTSNNFIDGTISHTKNKSLCFRVHTWDA